MTPEFKSVLVQGAPLLNLNLSDRHIQLIETHADQLVLWNKKINLTAIKTPEGIAEKHFLDSLAAALFIKNNDPVIDLGSGGGFPGLPIKIMHPEIPVTMVDASRKKVNFLKHVIRTLGLQGIDAVHSRVEDLHHDPQFSGQFGCVISRAFTELENFVDLAVPFLSKNGCICAMKGKNADKEMTQKIQDEYLINSNTYQLPFEKSDRNIMLLRRK